MDGLVQSAFWHRFALTVHSPIAADPDRFGIAVKYPKSRKGRIFRRNELEFLEPGAPDWDEIGAALRLAMCTYLEGRGLDKRPGFWKRAVQKRKAKKG